MADAPQVVYKAQAQEVLPSPPVPTYEEKQTYTHTNYHMGNLEAAQQHGQVLGLRQRNFWILIFLALVVLCAAIGGSVGGTLAVQNARSNAILDTSSNSNPETSPSPSSPSSSSSSPPTNTPATPSPPTRLPSNTLLPPSTTATPFPSNTPYTPLPATLVPTIDNSCASPTLTAFNGASYACSPDSNFFGADITGIIAYTLQQCVDACSTMNEVAGQRRCVAVALNHDLAAAYRNLKGANCWLKSGVEGGRQPDRGVSVALLGG
ncbi:hypothetical protein J1614_006826 [Plenodomus biglobosus]|nr:hypothetical protein J1614_006826 [Plenodomus biglobosus]